METGARIEEVLEFAIARASGAGAPPLLASALHYAVFPRRPPHPATTLSGGRAGGCNS